MAADDPLLLNIAESILDGRPVDWSSLATDATDSQRVAFQDLQAIAAIGSLSRRAPAPPRFPAFLVPTDSTWGSLKPLEPIGQGAFGIVYRAWDPKLDREVALKLLPADESALNTLEEGRLLARIHHPNVVTIFGADHIGSFVGLWMELVPGHTLERELTDKGPFSPERTIEIGQQLCRALAAVHGAGLVHRDVKAHNVTITPAGRVVLMDFGAGGLRARTAEAMAGTPLYLAPEIFDGAPATEQSDVYSAGVLLYHLLTGRYPIEGRSLGEIRNARQKGAQPADLRVTRPDVPRRLALALASALATRPADRFFSAEMFRQALADALPKRWVVSLTVALALAATVAVAVAVGGRFSIGIGGANRSGPPAQSDVDANVPGTRRLSLPDAALIGSGLSYDGRYFSFINTNDDLAVADIASGQSETLVTAAGEQFPEFSVTSPNGDRVAYQWMTEKHSYELRVVDRQTRKVRVLLQNESFDYPLPIQWSADGSVVLVWSKDLQGTGYIVLVDAASGQANTVRTIPQGEPSGLSLSPDHRFIAYDLPRSAAQRERTLHVLDVTSREDRTVVAAHGANDRFPLWTPDGGHLFFISDRSGSPDGWLLPLENGVQTGEPWLIVRNLGRVTSLGLTENGAFYYDLMAGVFEVREMALDEASTTSKAVATQFAGSNIAPSYSPDGEKLAYTSVREGLGGRPKRTITIKEFKTGAERELSTPLDVGNTPSRWSPDGSRLLVTGVDRADRRATRILDAESGAILHEFNPQANRELGDYGPVRWTADGRGVLYEHVGSGLLMHPLDGGRDQMIYPYDSKSRFERIHRFEVSPDGSRLAISGFLKSNKGTALHIVAAGGEVELARRESPEMLVVQAWSADGTALYFTTLKPNGSMPQDLWRMSVTGDAPQHLGSLLSMTQINPIAIHPRGTTVAFTAGTPLRELWMMEHFLPQR